jgi:hypothetical protein
MTIATKPVRRETAVIYRGRPLICELRPWGVILREKGRRLGVPVDYRAIYEFGFKIMARQAAAEKEKARKAKGKAR